MNNHDNPINNNNNTTNQQDDEKGEAISSMTKVTEGGGDTYTISDNESTTNSTSLIDTNITKDEDQGELNGK